MKHLFSHPVLEATLVRLGSHYDVMRPAKVIAIVGCGGAGKSETNAMALRQRYRFESMWQNNRTPVAYTMGVLPKNAYFSSLQFVKAARSRVMFPLVDWMQTGDARQDAWVNALKESIATSARLVRVQRDLPESDQWELLQKAVHEYCVKVLVIEHATAFLTNHKDTTPAEHLFNLISWSEETGVTVVLIGGPRLAAMWMTSEELSRRVLKVWVPPYGDSDEQLERFSRVFGTMLSQYPGADLSLTGLTEEVHTATGGLIGQLRALLDRASAGDARLTAKSIRSSFVHAGEAQRIWSSIVAFREFSSVATKVELKAAKELALTARVRS